MRFNTYFLAMCFIMRIKFFIFGSLLFSLLIPAFADISVSAGENQIIPADSLSKDIGFEVLDEKGNPSSGVTVNFSLTDSMGKIVGGLSNDVADTDSMGQVTTQVSALDKIGSYEVTAQLATDTDNAISVSTFLFVTDSKLVLPEELKLGFGNAIDKSYRISPTDNVESASTYLFITDLPSDLPKLCAGNAIDKNGDSSDTQTYFMGGISVNGGDFKAEIVLNDQDVVFVKGMIEVDSNHIGQTADIFATAGHLFTNENDDNQETQHYYMLDKLGKVSHWDGNMATLEAFRHNLMLPEELLVNIYGGQFGVGILDIWFGYRLENGTMVLNSCYPIHANTIQEN